MELSREKLLQDLAETLVYTAKSMHNLVEFPLKKHELKVGQMEILFHLAKHPEGMCVKDLAALMHITSGAITQYTNDLVEQELIIRKENENDRRLLELTLSPEAQEKYNKFKELYFTKIEEFFINLSDTDAQTLLTILRNI